MMRLLPIHTLPDRYPNMVQFVAKASLAGLAFPTIAITLDLAWQDLTPTIWNIMAIQAHPLHWIMNAMPVILGFLAAIPGYRMDILAIENSELEQQLTGQAETLEGNELLYRQAIEKRQQAMEALKKAKAELEKSASARTQFLSTVSHEMRTPLNAVIGMSGLLLESGLSKEQREYTDTIKRSGNNLLETINNILDYSKLESGSMELRSEEFVLAQILDEVIDAYAIAANEKGLELVYEIDEEVPARFTGDALRVRQIIANLVANAVKFTEKGEVVVMLRRLESDNEGTTLEVSVRDTGIGISEEHIGRLFRPFIQVEGNNTRHFGGTGLGLAITRGLVEAMGGKIQVDSNPGKGAIFTFTLQLAPGVTRAAPYTVETLIGKRIFILEVNPANLRALDHLCHSAGMKTIIFNDSDEFLKAMPAVSQFEIGIISHSLSGLDGLKVATRVRELAGKEQLALVLLTPSPDSVDAKAGEHFNLMLPKPVRHIALLKALGRIVN